jgi:hypothetical protein
MATIDLSGEWLSRGVHKTIWEGMSSGDVGSAQGALGGSIITVQVTGTITAGTLYVEGSNNTATGPFETLQTVTGGAASLTATGILSIEAPAAFTRPRASGTTAADMDVIMISSQNF